MERAAVINKDFVGDEAIAQGATFNPRIQYSQPDPISVVDIGDITNSGRAHVTAEGHGLTTDWRVYILGVKGMTRINHQSEALADPFSAYRARVLDADTIEIDVDTTRFGTYISSGELRYRPPVDLTGFTARMQIRKDIDDAEPLLELTTENGGLALGGSTGVVEILITASDSADLDPDDFESAVYDLELVDPSTSPATVIRLMAGKIRLSKEVTR